MYELLSETLPGAAIWIIAWGLAAGAIVSIGRVLQPVLKRIWHLMRLIEFLNSNEPLFDQIKSIRTDLKETRKRVDNHLNDHERDRS